jgi:hypothetical protein
VTADVRIRRRVWVEGALVLDEEAVEPVDKSKSDGPDFAKRVGALAQGRRHMVELEFLDEPNPLTRFIRFGTDPSMMDIPLRVR